MQQRLPDHLTIIRWVELVFYSLLAIASAILCLPQLTTFSTSSCVKCLWRDLRLYKNKHLKMLVFALAVRSLRLVTLLDDLCHYSLQRSLSKENFWHLLPISSTSVECRVVWTILRPALRAVTSNQCHQT